MLSPGAHISLQQGAMGVDGDAGRGSPRGPSQDSAWQDEFPPPRLTAPWASSPSSLPCSKSLCFRCSPLQMVPTRTRAAEGKEYSGSLPSSFHFIFIMEPTSL